MSKRRYFGTDGIRGKLGQAPITPEMVLKLGWAAGRVLAQGATDHAKILIGKDTRVSGYLLESALEAGLSAAGVDIRLLGPMPTPAIAYLTRTARARAGIVISASHNPYDDNGIKFFSSDGSKLPDETEAAIEEMMQQPLTTVDSARLGKAKRYEDASGRYIEFCKSTFPHRLSLEGLRIVVDCANGAAYHIAPLVFSELGADVIAVANEPDGFNINRDCGSTHPECLRRAVREHRADLGLALDGDGDRVIMMDGRGEIVDGDHLLYIIALDRKRAGRLRGGVVGTLMSNFGLEQALRAHGIAFERAPVGDRYVLAQLQEKGWELGGETSGHIICLDRASTGDGIVAALQALAALRESGKSLGELKSGLEIYPQTMINVRMHRRFDLKGSPPVQRALREAERELADAGRVVLRASGTEPVVRVMVEGRDASQVERLSRQLADTVQRAAEEAA
ncbi:MAG: phosphoglucosamine mutase [Candidatus Muproteobacteria bacterium RBG_16_65_34]|uniref:Phosphoglucosamine mutase n=1 Tax=Candidatus Muproteobacteria bacterium RBG_16_65_34 TaxID=1817760 RepID=A0A1F6TKT6_9PROT|nr:MAG: phosphoglucosamine mutase [Candidatus Muproteobacteria bacterium RBG_16_65_34]